MLEKLGQPIKSLTSGQKNNDLLNSFSIDKSLFYTICGQANQICTINYDTITLIDLLSFFSIYCRDSYIDISMNKRRESELKAKKMFNMLKNKR